MKVVHWKYPQLERQISMDRRTLWARWPQLAPPFRCSTKSPAPDVPENKECRFVHGLFADGSSSSKVIPGLQEKGINCTSVQNPLTSLQEASKAVRRAIALQPGPTVLVGHSFSGMIVDEGCGGPEDRRTCYVAARAPDAGEDYAALAKNTQRHLPPPAYVQRRLGPVDRGGSCTTSRATCRRKRHASSTRFSSLKKSLNTDRTTNAPGAPGPPSTPCPPKTGRSIPTSSVSWPSGWVRRRSRSVKPPVADLTP